MKVMGGNKYWNEVKLENTSRSHVWSVCERVTWQINGNVFSLYPGCDDVT